MKELVAHSGILIPRVYSESDIKHGRLEFPLVLKPKSLAGAVGVKIVNNQQELSSFIEKNKLRFARKSFTDMDVKEYQVEQFIDGRVLHIDGIYTPSSGIRFYTVSEYT